jgi:hypothetical protein
MVCVAQVWYQNRRAKWRKKDHTKKGPGRPAHNAHPQTCSGEPIPHDELLRKEKDRKERKILKSLEKQQKKLALKGIQVDIEALRRDWETQRRRHGTGGGGAGGGSGGGTGGGQPQSAFTPTSAGSGGDSIASGALAQQATDLSSKKITIINNNNNNNTTTMTTPSIQKRVNPFSIESLLCEDGNGRHRRLLVPHSP